MTTITCFENLHTEQGVVGVACFCFTWHHWDSSTGAGGSTPKGLTCTLASRCWLVNRILVNRGCQLGRCWFLSQEPTHVTAQAACRITGGVISKCFKESGKEPAILLRLRIRNQHIITSTIVCIKQFQGGRDKSLMFQCRTVKEFMAIINTKLLN